MLRITVWNVLKQALRGIKPITSNQLILICSESQLEKKIIRKINTYIYNVAILKKN